MTTVGSGSRRAFTLIELLVVIGVIAILAVLIGPPPSHNMGKARMIYCMNNIRQVGIGLHLWSMDHTDDFPFQVSVTNGGSMDLIASSGPAAQFQTLTNYLTNLANVLICPTERKRRATTNSILTDRNVSYFLNIDSDPNQTNAVTQILSGDRHLALEGKPIAPGLFTLATNSNTSFSWTEELHSKGRQPGGILLFLDGHSEFSGAARLAKIVQRQPLATNRLLIP